MMLGHVCFISCVNSRCRIVLSKQKELHVWFRESNSILRCRGWMVQYGMVQLRRSGNLSNRIRHVHAWELQSYTFPTIVHSNTMQLHHFMSWMLRSSGERFKILDERGWSSQTKERSCHGFRSKTENCIRNRMKQNTKRSRLHSSWLCQNLKCGRVCVKRGLPIACSRKQIDAQIQKL